jgi:hypothetical protein
MKRWSAALCLAALLAGCSSASVGGDDVLDQADKATQLQLEATLRNAAATQETFRVSTGSYTTNPNVLETEGLNVSPEITLTIPTGDASTYCMEATHASEPNAVWHVASGGSPEAGGC